MMHPRTVFITRKTSLRPKAFTFLEVTVATAMMAMIALTLYQAMRVGFKARDRATAAVGASRTGELAIDIVRRDLESALPLRGVLAGTGMMLGGAGPEIPGTSGVQFFMMSPPPAVSSGLLGNSSNNMSSLSRGPSSMDRQDVTRYGGVRRVELMVRNPINGTAGDGVLVRRIVRNLLAPTEPTPDEEIVCRGVTAFTVRYYDGLQWYDEWDSTQYGDTLPMAVEVSLEVRGTQDPTRASDDARTGQENQAVYRTTRIFNLPCCDQTALSQGGAS